MHGKTVKKRMIGPVLTESVRRLLNSPEESEEIKNSRDEQFSFVIGTRSYQSATGKGKGHPATGRGAPRGSG